jgi:hypothetical protein
MRGKLGRFLLGLAVWEGIVFVPVGIVLLRAGRSMQSEDLAWLLPIALCGVLIIGVCYLFALRFGPTASASLGFLCGVSLMIASGYAWAHIVRGFEASAGAFAISVRLAIPSGIGSGVASWLNRRRSLPE